MPVATMLESEFYGKLLPTHPDIMAILRHIRNEYDIPEISPTPATLRCAPGSPKYKCGDAIP